ncbi:conserved hypothetical protein [Bosea sp. 62]|uniref:phage tail tip lysozyme n=1 Tax=unclassified Bosea (in: a-proteobacteria) TaxID=2653178 RepID=UPI00125AF8BA|nr:MULTISPECIES: phage tail tip lysozyme [unclassified Bosea (in: a-proteobacteria)]CAD5254398.1 conserved hypothetical protein [Bosea sp. 7B]CAD5276637.1 conserved hypothetical protein [Bosea sp. 21B]CAD5277782.1 conserved hypothetical protein [Bosea sp. 46]VVT59858.1 conserved hypothetical protein [Bosea sp. EC-HK365B]VXB46342.1 conserved hypothetical protein [Bosea sp. 62]
MAGDVIKEFLVSLGFRVEPGQEKKFSGAVTTATNSVVALGKAAAVASAAVSAAVVKISRSFDSLYWQAQRTQTTVSQIKAVSYAVSQLGGSAESAGSSIETFGKNLKWNPGFEGFLKQIGVVTRENGKLRDSVALLKDFANTIKGRSRAEQMGLAEFAGVDLKTLEALQNGQLAKRMAEHSATLKRLGVDEDEAARKANALQVALGKLSDTLGGIGTLLLDRFGPGLTGTFEKLDEFLVQNSDKIVAFFDKLGKVASELAGIFEKLLEVLGPLWQKFDNLTQSIAGVDGLTAALVALIGLKVSGWLLGVAAAIAKVGTAASVALLGGSLGKFLRLFGIGGAIALGMSPTEANGGEDQEIARRRAAGTFGPASPGDLEADAAKRQQGQSKDTSLWGKVKRWWRGGGDPSNGAATAPKGSAAKLAAAQESYDFWRSKGLSHEAASGLVANEEAESAFNPNARGDGGRAHGLYQHHPDRRANILRGTGIDMSSADARQQREGAYWEMTKGQERKTWNMLQGVTSAGEAGAIVSREYERPADRAGEANKRAAAANGWSARLQQQSTEVTPSAAGSGGQAEAYRRKTGRDLQSDINSKDPYVRDWAAKEAGLTPNSKDDGGSVKMPSFGDRVREADRQTAMGRVQSYEDAIAQAGANVGKIDGGGLGGNGASLTPPPGSTAGTTVTVNQENHVSVTGSGDPHDTAQQIGNTQRDVNAGMVRDLKGAVR